MLPNEHEAEPHHQADFKPLEAGEPTAPGQSAAAPKQPIPATARGQGARTPKRGKKLTNWLTSGGKSDRADLQPRELIFDLPDGQTLTPFFLTTKLLPYLLAIDELQRVVELLNSRPMKGLVIHSIVGNAVSIGFGGSGEIVNWIIDRFDHWRVRHGDQLTALEEDKLAIDIEAARAGLEMPVRSAPVGMGHGLGDAFVPEVGVDSALSRDQAQAEQASQLLDFAARQEALQQAQLQIRKELLELEKAKFQLAADFVHKFCPTLTEQDHLPVVSQVKRQIDLMLDTKLQLKSETRSG